MSLMSLMSFCIGLIMGFVIGLIVFKRQSKDYHGPNSKDIVGIIFDGKDGKYYKFTPEICACPLL